jgi:hypothetical protein
MQINNKNINNTTTYEGGLIRNIDNKKEFRRAVLTCMLWENSFYEKGNDIAERIKTLIPNLPSDFVAQVAVEARLKMNLRHIPLFVVREMSRHQTHKHLVADTLYQIINRPDELTEFLAIYWKDGRCPLSNQVKKGLAKAFTKFNEYSLAKYNQDKEIKLRDVLFLVHAKPLNNEQALIWKKLINNELETPITWETQISKHGNKKEVWEMLLSEGKLGALATLRNLRNMISSSVDTNTIKRYLLNLKTDMVLPYRFIAAATHAPQIENELEKLMLKSLTELPKLVGKTILLVDVSGSMDVLMSNKSDLTRLDAAFGLAILARELCENVSVYSFSRELKLIPNRRGFALRDAITNSQPHSSTYLGNALNSITESYDRIIVFTDEQSADAVPNPKGKGYIINVASYNKSVAHGRWNNINGFSENIFNYVQELEQD